MLYKKNFGDFGDYLSHYLCCWTRWIGSNILQNVKIIPHQTIENHMAKQLQPRNHPPLIIKTSQVTSIFKSEAAENYRNVALTSITSNIQTGRSCMTILKTKTYTTHLSMVSHVQQSKNFIKKRIFQKKTDKFE